MHQLLQNHAAQKLKLNLQQPAQKQKPNQAVQNHAVEHQQQKAAAAKVKPKLK
jgi:hypothetical protein